MQQLDEILIATGAEPRRDTPQEALAQAQEAMALWIETAIEFGDPVPEPSGRRLMYA